MNLIASSCHVIYYYYQSNITIFLAIIISFQLSEYIMGNKTKVAANLVAESHWPGNPHSPRMKWLVLRKKDS